MVVKDETNSIYTDGDKVERVRFSFTHCFSVNKEGDWRFHWRKK